MSGNNNNDPSEPKKAESSSTGASTSGQPSETFAEPTRANQTGEPDSPALVDKPSESRVETSQQQCSNANREHDHQADGKKPQSTGFDAVVQADREKRKLTFGPNCKKIVKPGTILIDIYGVISSWSFGSVLKVFAKQNIEFYVKENWNSKMVKNVVLRLREQAVTDRSAGLEVPLIAESTEDVQTQVESAVKNILWQMDKKIKSTKPFIDRLCTDLWSKSYESGKLKTHAYEEMADVFQYWRYEEFIKIYTYASGSVDGQRLFLRSSSVGDLNSYIANPLNASGGYKYDPDKYKCVVVALREPNPQQLMYITDCPKKARNAIKAGMRAIVVNCNEDSHGSKYSAQATEGLVVVNSLAEIQWVDGDNGPVQGSCC